MLARWAATALAAFLPLASAGARQLAVTDLRPVATGPGVRDRPVALHGPAGYTVFWEGAPTPMPSLAPGRNFRLFRRDLGRDGVPSGEPEVVAGQWSHQWGASPAAGPSRTWLAYYFADRTLRTGDRDLALLPWEGWFGRRLPSVRLTRDRPGGPPVNHSSPALLFDPDASRLIVASSVGVWHGDTRGEARAYDSVNIEVRLLDLGGREQRRFLVRGPDQPGEAATPSLAILPPTWRERYILAYASNAGRRALGVAGYTIYLELFDPDWRAMGGRHLALEAAGSARPSVAVVGGRLYLAWVDHATTDIVIAELDQELAYAGRVSLREAIRGAGLAPRFGPGSPGLSAPHLFDDQGQLGVAFVATQEWRPDAGRVRQEVFLARLRPFR